MQVCANAAGWLFLIALVYAPWAYGCTRPWTIAGLEILLAAVVVLWLAACLALRRRPLLPWPCLALVALLLAQGWFMAWNAHHFYDAEAHEFAPVLAPISAAPGAVDREVAVDFMWRVTSLLGAMLVAIDLFQESRWRRRFAWTVIFAGASLTAFGVAQRLLEAPGIFWGASRSTPHFFATYLYHGNAGSFINLVLPVAILWTVRMFREPRRHLARAIYLPATLAVVAAAFINVSRAAMALSLALLLILLVLHLPEIWRQIRDQRAARLAVTTFAIAGAAAVLLFSGAWDLAWQRWQKIPANFADNSREIAVNVGWKMAADAGATGFGPGTFALAFPHYAGEAGGRIAGVWRYLHQDYLQTRIEWGWLGAGLWALLLGGGGGLALWHGCKKSAPLSEARPLYLAAALGLGATALHALVDFPFQIASLQLYLMSYVALGWSAWFRR